jgi:serine/threonine protein kinase
MDCSLEKIHKTFIHLKLKTPKDDFYSRIAYCVLKALSFMKKLNLIHRDIRPANILLNKRGEVKLCDFGISGLTKESICNSYAGFHRYMAVSKKKNKRATKMHNYFFSYFKKSLKN